MDRLNTFGGQAITHVASIERADGADVTIDELQFIVDRLQDFLSYATGQRPKGCLPFGYDANETPIWEMWYGCGASYWSPSANWRMDHVKGNESALFPGYLQKCTDQGWSEPIEIAIDWYVQSKTRGIDTALVLGQSALDLLANTLFESGSHGDIERFDRECAADKLRWLLEQLRIPAAIPPQLQALLAFRYPDGKQFEDGPHAITELRNAIAHPKRANREKWGTKADDLRADAATLVLFILEHALLRLFGFHGLASAHATHRAVIDYRVAVPAVTQLGSASI